MLMFCQGLAGIDKGHGGPAWVLLSSLNHAYIWHPWIYFQMLVYSSSQM